MLKKVFIGLAGLCLALCAVGLLLPGSVRVERSILIDRPPAAVFAVVDDISRFNAWSPWYGIDPNAKFEFSGPSRGVGATLTWSGNDDVGSGTQRIVTSIPLSRVDVALEFKGFGNATASYLLEPEAGGTRVRWVYQAEYGLNPPMRWLGLFMDGWVGPDYEKGLSKLKALVERPSGTT
jgi:hypothetical protein